MYIGIRQRRDNTEKYDQLIDEVIMTLRKRYGNKRTELFLIVLL